jgi:hypothetical protein
MACLATAVWCCSRFCLAAGSSLRSALSPLLAFASAVSARHVRANSSRRLRRGRRMRRSAPLVLPLGVPTGTLCRLQPAVWVRSLDGVVRAHRGSAPQSRSQFWEEPVWDTRCSCGWTPGVVCRLVHTAQSACSARSTLASGRRGMRHPVEPASTRHLVPPPLPAGRTAGPLGQRPGGFGQVAGGDRPNRRSIAPGDFRAAP